ncbi:MAG: DMT family transporter [Nitrospinae bacterium]|nr:DMT family transporter [Nitrospinota bacterium]
MLFKADWFIFSLIALFLWGLWGFLSKIATYYVGPTSVFLYGSVGALLVSIFSVISLGFRFEVHPIGIILGTLTGVLGAAGVIFFFFAMKEGNTTVIVTMTALYPLVTLLLSYLILREPITLKQTVGILFAIIAMVLLS